MCPDLIACAVCQAITIIFNRWHYYLIMEYSITYSGPRKGSQKFNYGIYNSCFEGFQKIQILSFFYL